MGWTVTPDEQPEPDVVVPETPKHAEPVLDSDIRYLLDRLAQSGAKPLSALNVEAARAQPTLAAIAREIAPGMEPSIVVEETSVETGHGPLGLRIYRPQPAFRGPLPGLVFFGDGLFVLGNGAELDGAGAGLAHRTGAVVICPMVRHAPEHRFPAPHVDALAFWKMLPELADDLGIEPGRMALGGEGAGANLALHVAFEARDSKLTPPIHLVLVTPWTTLGVEYPAAAENPLPGFLSAADLGWAARKLVRKRVDLREPRLNPGARMDFKGLPPTTIILAEHDPLRAEGEALAGRFRSEGMWVDMQVMAGTVHGFFGLDRVVNKAMLAQGRVSLNLRVTFESVLSRRARQI